MIEIKRKLIYMSAFWEYEKDVSVRVNKISNGSGRRKTTPQMYPAVAETTF